MSHFFAIPTNNIFLNLTPESGLEFIFNPFVPNAPFLYPRKTSENLTVF